MWLLYTDETNLEERRGDFFTYAGLALDCDQALLLSQTIDAIRKDSGVPRNFHLKFNPCPDELNHADFNLLKQAIIEAAVQHGAKLLVSVILHDIATSPDEARRNGINTVCYHFDCLLNRFKSSGLVLIDRFSDKQIDAHLAEKFCIGVTRLPSGKSLELHASPSDRQG